MMSLLAFAVTSLAFAEVDETPAPTYLDTDDIMEQEIADTDDDRRRQGGLFGGLFGGAVVGGGVVGGHAVIHNRPTATRPQPTPGFPGFPTQPTPPRPTPGFPGFPGFPTQPAPATGLGALTNLNAFGSNGNVNSNIVGAGHGIPAGGLSNINIGSSGNRNTNFVGGRRRLMSIEDFVGAPCAPVLDASSGTWSYADCVPTMPSGKMFFSSRLNALVFVQPLGTTSSQFGGPFLEDESLIAPDLDETIAEELSFEA